jgi:class 3 adenylate cyclase
MSEMGPGAADIADVVPEVKERLPGLPAPPQLEPEQARFRLFDSITTFLRNASQRQPHVLVLDDLHWADKPSLLLLQFMARELRGSRLLVLGTYRDVELRRAHPLSQTLGELSREGLSHRILLRGLTEHDVERFIEIAAGVKAHTALVEAVYRETEGNPFFVNEVVRLLVADGRLDKPEDVTSWSVTIPQGVREVVGRRLDHLSEGCNQVLTMASVIGRDFGLATLDKVSKLSGDDLLDVLEEAVAARVIAEVPNQVEYYTFTHALIKETLYEELSTARRVRAHRQIGEVLEEQHSDDLDSHLPQLAYHFSEAAQGGDADKAIGYAMRAGERSIELLAYEEAAGHFERASQVLDLKEAPDERQREEILVTLGSALARAGQGDAAVSILKEAMETPASRTDAELFAKLALVYADAVISSSEPFGGRAWPVLRDALEVIGSADSATRVRLLARLGSLPVLGMSTQERFDFAREAIEVADRIGDASGAIPARLALVAALGGPDHLDERMPRARELVTLASEAGAKSQEMFGHLVSMACALRKGNIDDVDEEISIIVPMADELREPLYLNWRHILTGMRAIMDGRWADAEGAAQEMMALWQRFQMTVSFNNAAILLYEVRRSQGRLAELEGPLQIIRQQTPNPTTETALAFMYCEQAETDKARVIFDQLAADGFENIPRDLLWSTAISLLIYVARSLEDRERTRTLYDMLLPLREENLVVGDGIIYIGSAALVLGVGATVLGDWDEAEKHFVGAIEMERRCKAPAYIARGQYEYALMLSMRDGPDDLAKALDLATEALSGFEQLGMKKDVERCLALKLELQGVPSKNTGASIDAVASLVYAEKPDLRPQAAPDGTVTLLFSDIEGSTAKTEELGDQRWMKVLREHNAIVREHLAANEGFEVKSEGDGFMLAFQSARKAIQCAIATQKAFAERSASSEVPIKVRMGLHTGEMIKEGDDFFGKHVNLAARIAAQADGGEILVSSLLRELTASGGDIEFGEPRSVELKGLAGVQEMFPVSWQNA